MQRVIPVTPAKLHEYQHHPCNKLTKQNIKESKTNRKSSERSIYYSSALLEDDIIRYNADIPEFSVRI